MPRLNGQDAAKIIRNAGFKGIVVGVTGDAQPEDVRAFVSSGADEVLIKPITAEKLDECLSRIIQKRLDEKMQLEYRDSGFSHE